MYIYFYIIKIEKEYIKLEIHSPVSPSKFEIKIGIFKDDKLTEGLLLKLFINKWLSNY